MANRMKQKQLHSWSNDPKLAIYLHIYIRMCIQNRCPALYLLAQLQNSNKVFVGSSIILAMAIIYSLGSNSIGISTTTFGCSSEALMRLEEIAFTPKEESRSTRHFDVAIFLIFVDCKRLANDFTGAACCACSSMAPRVQHNDDEGDEEEAARREWNSRRNATACSYFSSPTSGWRGIVDGTMVMRLFYVMRR